MLTSPEIRRVLAAQYASERRGAARRPRRRRGASLPGRLLAARSIRGARPAAGCC